MVIILRVFGREVASIQYAPSENVPPTSATNPSTNGMKSSSDDDAPGSGLGGNFERAPTRNFGFDRDLK